MKIKQKLSVFDMLQMTGAINSSLTTFILRVKGRVNTESYQHLIEASDKLSEFYSELELYIDSLKK